MQNTTMSITDCNKMYGPSPLDIIPAEPIADIARQDGGAFNEYLQRANNSSTDINSSANNLKKYSTQPLPARNDDADSPATNLTSENSKDNSENSGDNIDANNEAESCPDLSLPKSDIKHSENKSEKANQEQDLYQEVDQDPEAPAVNKDEEKNEKDVSDSQDRLALVIDQNNQPKTHKFSETNRVISLSQSGQKTSAAQDGIKEISNPMRLTSENATKAADPVAVAKTDTLAENVTQTAVVKDGEAATPKSAKDSISEKGVRDAKITTENIPAAQKTVEMPSITEHKEFTATKTLKDNSASNSNRDASRKSSHKTEPDATSTTDATDAAVMHVGAQEAAVSAQTVNLSSLQTAAKPQTTPTNQPKDKIESEAGNIVSKNKADDPSIVLQRLGQSTTKTSAGTAQSNGGEIGPHFDQARFVQRVERAFAAMGQRDGAVRLKLSPPELGSVRVEITVKKGMMKARLEAETKETKNMLLENLPALRDRLAQQNIKIQEFDVDLRHPSSGDTPQQTAGQSGSESNESGHRPGRQHTREPAPAATASTGAASISNHNGQLNVIV